MAGALDLKTARYLVKLLPQFFDEGEQVVFQVPKGRTRKKPYVKERFAERTISKAFDFRAFLEKNAEQRGSLRLVMMDKAR